MIGAHKILGFRESMDEMPSIKKVYSGAFYNNCTGNRALLMQHAGLSGYQDPEPTPVSNNPQNRRGVPTERKS
jgi:hypothetical protein